MPVDRPPIRDVPELRNVVREPGWGAVLLLGGALAVAWCLLA